MKLCRGERYPFDCAGIYEIHVLGIVGPHMSDYLAGMYPAQVRSSVAPDVAVTVLTGWLPDQAALNGVLNTLYDRRYTLTRVQRVGDGSPQNQDSHAEV